MRKLKMNKLFIRSSKDVTVEIDYVYTANGIYTVKVAGEVFYAWYKQVDKSVEYRFVLLNDKGEDVVVIGTTPKLNGSSVIKNHIRDAFISYMIGIGELEIK